MLSEVTLLTDRQTDRQTSPNNIPWRLWQYWSCNSQKALRNKILLLCRFVQRCAVIIVNSSRWGNPRKHPWRHLAKTRRISWRHRTAAQAQGQYSAVSNYWPKLPVADHLTWQRCRRLTLWRPSTNHYRRITVTWLHLRPPCLLLWRHRPSSLQHRYVLFV